MGHVYWAMGQFLCGSVGHGSLPVAHCLLCCSVCSSIATASRAKTDKPIAVPLGLFSRVGPANHASDKVHIGATLRIRLRDPCAPTMRPYARLL